MRSVLTILAGAWCASLAVAQPATTTRETTTVSYHRVSTIVGTSFQLGTTAVGKVTEVVFNDSGCIEYLVVQESEGYVVVPWTITTVNYEQKVVTVQSTTVTVEKLRELRFTGDRWPNFADQTYAQKVQTVWGASAVRGSRAGEGGSTANRKEAGTTSPKKVDPTAPDRKGTGTSDPKEGERPKEGTRPMPPTKSKETEKPAGPKPTEPPDRDPPSKTDPKKTDPKKDQPEKDKKDKKDPDQA